MAYRRGFKSYANTIAMQVRSDFQLRAVDRLDPWALAQDLEIPMWPLSDLAEAPDAVAHLTKGEPEAFSAVTVFQGTKRTIIYNDAHVRGRQASDIAHELAHGLLQHRPTPALNDQGCRLWDQGIEDEARWLGGVLLIPEDGALWIVREGMSEVDAAEPFGVTPPMVRYRVNVTGAKKRVARAQRFRVQRIDADG
jgi:Zn-dependent peptidase ImmA (M78 family)